MMHRLLYLCGLYLRLPTISDSLHHPYLALIPQQFMRKQTIWIGPLLAAISGFVASTYGLSPEAIWTIAVAVLCIVWWVFEPIPIPVTSCLPVAVLPLVGALPMTSVSQAYGSPLILLLLGGFILATALAHSGAHERLAIFAIRLFGNSSPRRIVFGFMTASAGLSMWISNTATTLMLLPIAMAVLARAPDSTRLATPLLLGIAYAANVGGIGTPIGTPPNLVFMQVYADQGLPPISFASWMLWAVPVVVLLVPCIGFWLTRSLGPGEGDIPMPEAKPWQPVERRVLLVFALTALAWVTRSEPFGGWSAWLSLPAAHDSHVALLAVVVMFLIPDGRGSYLLNWETASKIPWGMLLLFAGGITLAAAFKATGISDSLGMLLHALTGWPTVLLVAVIALSVTFMTEMTSNTATTALLMPVLAAAAIATSLDPLLLMVPAAMSASCAFMLPVATPPNTIVYSTGRFSAATLAREGFVLNLVGAAVITTVCVIALGG